MKTLIVPTIHLNGTSADDLYEQYSEIVAALRLGEYALAKSGPNGRDYYPQGPSAINTAITQHENWLGQVRNVLAEVVCVMQAIARERDEREARKR